MSKFCTNCGRELHDGEVCNCSKNNDIKSALSDVMDILKKLFSKPMDLFDKYLVDSKYLVGICLIVLSSLVRGIYEGILSYRSWKSMGSFKYVKAPNFLLEFLKNSGLYIVRYGVFILVIYLVINVIFKDKISWKKIINAVGLAVTIFIFGYAVNSILILFNGNSITHISGYVSTFMSTFNIIMLYKAISHVSSINKNKLFISLPLIFIGVSIVMEIIYELIY